jgi:hypothetical protein
MVVVTVDVYVPQRLMFIGLGDLDAQVAGKLAGRLPTRRLSGNREATRAR